MLWRSKSHRSSGQRSTPLCAKLAVIATRETVCCWTTAKKRNACSLFLGTVSTATIFWKRYYRLKRSCTQRSYGKTESMDNCPKKSYPKYFEMRYAQERTYDENNPQHENYRHRPRVREYFRDIWSPSVTIELFCSSTFSAASIASLMALPTRVTPHWAAKERYSPLLSAVTFCFRISNIPAAIWNCRVLRDSKIIARKPARALPWNMFRTHNRHNKKEQNDSCSYIQRGTKKQKEIECPHPTLSLVKNTRYGADVHKGFNNNTGSV